MTDNLRWRPIADAPKDGEFVLLRFPPSYSSPGIAVGAWLNDGWWLTAIWAASTLHGEPTHWYPLPPHPQEPGW
jgi:hypothetical protein